MFESLRFQSLKIDEMANSRSLLQKLINPFVSKSRKDQSDVDLEKIASQEQKEFSFETLVAATKNFHPTRKLGEGGFGPVFKGQLDDGREIAVKKLSQSSVQGAQEFQIESKLLARMQHKNVVTLLGYCVHGREQLLVYQYVVNQSLDKLLFKSNGQGVLDWERRYGIILGVAKGLLYLHEESHCRIIHRDIKASNILLDDKWVPKIADFGMARLYPEDQTHVKTRVAGTNGYMAPEYLMHGYLSEKADVFSFGVVVLEIISGQKNSKFKPEPHSRSLLEWAYKLYKKNKSFEIIDPTIGLSADNRDRIAMCIQIGLLCVQSNPKLRPDMSRVVVILSKPRLLEEPQRPGYPGSRYVISRLPAVASSAASTSGSCGLSESFGSTTSTSTTFSATTAHTTSSRFDPHASVQ